MGGNRDDFSAKTKDIMAKQVAFRCSNPHCRQVTCGAGTAKDSVLNIGVAAHICAAAPGGKRYDPEMTEKERKDIDNGIWLCQSCAKLIDSDEVQYTVEVLRDWKEWARRRAAMELEFRAGDGAEHSRILNEMLKEISTSNRNFKILYVERFLNMELERLVDKMEVLQRKIEMVKNVYDGYLAEIYEIQFQNVRSLFLDINKQIEMIREQEYIIRTDREILEFASQSNNGKFYCRISWENPIKKLQGEMEHMAHMLIDTWKMVDVIESGFVECDMERNRWEHDMKNMLVNLIVK